MRILLKDNNNLIYGAGNLPVEVELPEQVETIEILAPDTTLLPTEGIAARELGNVDFNDCLIQCVTHSMIIGMNSKHLIVSYKKDRTIEFYRNRPAADQCEVLSMRTPVLGETIAIQADLFHFIKGVVTKVTDKGIEVTYVPYKAIGENNEAVATYTKTTDGLFKSLKASPLQPASTPAPILPLATAFAAMSIASEAAAPRREPSTISRPKMGQ